MHRRRVTLPRATRATSNDRKIDEGNPPGQAIGHWSSEMATGGDGQRRALASVLTTGQAADTSMMVEGVERIRVPVGYGRVRSRYGRHRLRIEVASGRASPARNLSGDSEQVTIEPDTAGIGGDTRPTPIASSGPATAAPSSSLQHIHTGALSVRGPTRSLATTMRSPPPSRYSAGYAHGERDAL